MPLRALVTSIVVLTPLLIAGQTPHHESGGAPARQVAAAPAPVTTGGWFCPLPERRDAEPRPAKPTCQAPAPASSAR